MLLKLNVSRYLGNMRWIFCPTEVGVSIGAGWGCLLVDMQEKRLAGRKVIVLKIERPTTSRTSIA